jgi:hypothetical protein
MCTHKHRSDSSVSLREKTTNNYVYLDVLENYALPQHEGLPNIIFQQDGAPPYVGNVVHQSQNAKFSNKWTCTGRPISWPPRSPSLRLLDFFFASM